jgi:hypothetical protein
MFATVGSADFDAESCAQGVPDFRVAPGWVGQRHLNDQLADVLGLGGTAASGVGAVVLPRGELAEPVENGGRLHEVAALLALIGREQLAGGSEAAALVDGKRELLATRGGVELFLENAPLFFHTGPAWW